MRLAGLILLMALSPGAVAQTIPSGATKPTTTEPQIVVPENAKPTPAVRSFSDEIDLLLQDLSKEKSRPAHAPRIARPPTDEERIAAQKREAQQKADAAMQSATTHIATGVASGAAQIGGASTEQPSQDPAKTKSGQKPAP